MATLGETGNATVGTSLGASSPESTRGFRNRVRAFFRPLSFSLVTDPDECERYVEASSLLFVAGLIAFVLALGGAGLLPHDEIAALLYRAGRAIVSITIAVISFLFACFYPHWKRHNLWHIEGTLSVLVAFYIISLFLYCLVLHTGSLNASAFSSAFFVVLTISFFLPKSAFMRCAFVAIVVTEAGFLIWTDIPTKRRHDQVMVGISVVTIFFIVVVRFFLDRLRDRKETSS